MVGVVTSAVAAVSLVGVGATTALAANETKHRDAAKAVAVVDTAGTTGPSSEQPTAGPTSTPRPTKAAASRSRTKRTSTPKASTPKTSTTRTKRAADPVTTTKTSKPTKTTSSPKPTKSTAAPADPTTEPPAVPSTGS
jgi:hypothetical protein